MTKENLQREYEILKNNYDDLLKEVEKLREREFDLLNYERLNLDLQCEVRNLRDELKEYRMSTINLEREIDTYKTVFEVLKGEKE